MKPELFVLTFFLILFIVITVNGIHRTKTELQRKRYSQLYDRLVCNVDAYPLTIGAEIALKGQFDQISKFRCCNREKLSVLELKFYKKFECLNSKRDHR